VTATLPEAHADAPEPPDRRAGELTLRELGRWGWRQLTSMRTALLLLLLLREVLRRGVVRLVRDVAAVDRGDRRRVRDTLPPEQPGCVEEQESPDEEHSDRDPDVLRGASHRLEHEAKLLGKNEKKGPCQSPGR
jgi:hypothetical protein